jgi:hypothetical protein
MMNWFTWLLESLNRAMMKKVKVYYEQIFKLAKFLQHKANNILLTIFFWARLVPYLQITIARMKQDTLFEHKESIVTCEETMVDVKE